jgi:hypothetical protein
LPHFLTDEFFVLVHADEDATNTIHDVGEDAAGEKHDDYAEYFLDGCKWHNVAVADSAKRLLVKNNTSWW